MTLRPCTPASLALEAAEDEGGGGAGRVEASVEAGVEALGAPGAAEALREGTRSGCAEPAAELEAAGAVRPYLESLEADAPPPRRDEEACEEAGLEAP